MAKDKGYSRRVNTDAISDGINDGSISIKQNYSDELLFGKKNYMFIIIGVGLMFLGLALMSGGHQPDPNEWDESLIYSPRRITLAPMVIILGLLVNVYAIFAKK
ncbi:MAG TPA: DUF3098 domain-containing protein [Saprospiraceae bacterium]|mgnify:CR=1 FL=1|nr:DUF3098 domain-containing protein [Saprospiraceae bacterium]